MTKTKVSALKEEKTFRKTLEKCSQYPLKAIDLQTIQVNIGLKCNLQCRHCHVASGPWRKEEMDWPVMEKIIEVACLFQPRPLVDITGGAPELNPLFTRFIAKLWEEKIPIQVRTNLTVHLLPEMEGILEFMAEHQVALVASLPCYLPENVDQQRGEGVYEESVQVLKKANDLGYGWKKELPLHLIYNPLGPKLPGPQKELEKAYKKELQERFGIQFTRLLTITNMPIGRFYGDLKREKKCQEYMALLQENFNPQTLPGLMCRHQISVRWDGALFDCDFNLALKLGLAKENPSTIFEFSQEKILNRSITIGRHCFGCTAGAGSSCGGSLVEDG